MGLKIYISVWDEDAQLGEEMMMNGWMDGSTMMWGAGWWGVAILVLAVLGIFALAKYIFFNK